MRCPWAGSSFSVSSFSGASTDPGVPVVASGAVVASAEAEAEAGWAVWAWSVSGESTFCSMLPVVPCRRSTTTLPAELAPAALVENASDQADDQHERDQDQRRRPRLGVVGWRR